jgi:hypothetical protein
MDQPKEDLQRFFGYPEPIQGPTVTYKKKKDENPVFRGTLLVVGAWLFVPLLASGT